MTGLAHLLGQIIGLALIPAALIWAWRGTRAGRVVRKAVHEWLAARRRHAEAQAWQARAVAYQRWVSDMAWWGWYRSQHEPGTAQFELAHMTIGHLELKRPPCPHVGETCPIPHCPNHPRSNQS